jgi:hypothetical protein
MTISIGEAIGNTNKPSRLHMMRDPNVEMTDEVVQNYLDPSTHNYMRSSKMILLDGGESMDSSFHELLLLLENDIVFHALRFHLNVRATA